MAMRNCVRGTCFDTVSAKDAAVVIDVIDLGIAFGTAHAVLGRVLGCLDIDAIRRAICGAQKTRYTFLQPIFVALQYVDPAIALLELRATKGPRTIGIVLHLRWLEHFPKGDAHALGDGGYVFEDRHTLLL